MKTRILLLTLLPSISILLLYSGLVFAGPITGCVRNGTGIIYNPQFREDPSNPCNVLDEKITWSEEGPKGNKGEPGQED